METITKQTCGVDNCTTLLSRYNHSGFCFRCLENGAGIPIEQPTVRGECKNRGHVLAEVGRTESGKCAECARIRKEGGEKEIRGAPTVCLYEIPGLKRVRIEKGFTHVQLAKILDVSNHTISKLENKKRKASQKTKDRIVRALGEEVMEEGE